MKQRKTIGMVFAATILLIGLSSCGTNKPTQISFSQQSIDLSVGDSAVLPLDIFLEKKVTLAELDKKLPFMNLVFTSANPDIVLVSEDGMVRAMGAGATVVTATVGDLYASIEITVHETLSEIIMDEILQVTQGETLFFVMHPVPINALLDEIALEVEQGSLATAALNKGTCTGEITGLQPGETTLYVSAGGYTKNVVVRVLPVKEGLTLSQTHLSLAPGQNTQLSVVGAVGGLSVPFLWNSNNPAVATVDGNGVITAHAPGQAIISVQMQDTGALGVAQVVVSPQNSAKNHPQNSPVLVPSQPAQTQQDSPILTCSELTPQQAPAQSQQEGVSQNSGSLATP